MSDSDKIGLQLYLDVQEYGNQLVQFGLFPTEMPTYQKLLEVVTPQKPAAVQAAGPQNVV